MIFTAADVHSRIKGEQPFRPVQLVTTTGQTYDINYPDLIMFASHFMYIGVPHKKLPFVADQVTRLAYVHLTEMRDLPTLTPPGANGQAGSVS